MFEKIIHAVGVFGIAVAMTVLGAIVFVPWVGSLFFTFIQGYIVLFLIFFFVLPAGWIYGVWKIFTVDGLLLHWFAPLIGG